MAIIGISLGSNQGNRKAFLEGAVQSLISKGFKQVALSSFYETLPEGYSSACLYLNQVMIAKSPLQPFEVLSLLQAIEQEAGRIRQAGIMSDRTLDLDLLFYDDLVTADPDLVLPHPRMHLRNFVLEPLLEVWPHWVHPLLAEDVGRMLAKLQETP